MPAQEWNVHPEYSVFDIEYLSKGLLVLLAEPLTQMEMQ